MSESAETVFITKYALSAGIREVPLLRRCENCAVVQWREPRIFNDGELLFGEKDHHDTWEAAIARAEAMRKAKIANYERLIAKLRKLSFDRS